jgi:hypothetical protein
MTIKLEDSIILQIIKILKDEVQMTNTTIITLSFLFINL